MVQDQLTILNGRSETSMVRKIGRLTGLAVTRATKPGFYADGGGLYLRVGRNVSTIMRQALVQFKLGGSGFI